MIRQTVNKSWIFMGRLDSFAKENKKNLIELVPDAQDLLIKMKQAGCLQIPYGVEAINPKIADSYNKKNNADFTNQVLALTAKAGIIPRAMMVMGGAYETEVTLQEMIEWARFSPALSFRLGYIVPLRGTPEWIRAEEKDLWINDELTRDIHQTTAEPVIKCPIILNDDGAVDSEKLKWFRGFHKTALQEIYQSPAYHQRVKDFISHHPDMSVVIRGMIYLFERQGLVPEGSFDKDFEDTVLRKR